MLTVLTALLLSLTFASAASAHGSVTVGADGNYQHDDARGNPACATVTTDNPCASLSAAGTHSATHPGSGAVDAVDNDSPADAVNVIRDYGLENAPIIIGVIGAIFLVGLTFYLVRRGLMKARGAMRL